MSRNRLAHVVYVIAEEPGACKIGIAFGRDANSRMEALQCGNPRRLRVAFSRIVEGREEALRIERIAHRRLRDRRLMGEWFDISVDEAAEAIQRASMPPPQVADVFARAMHHG